MHSHSKLALATALAVAVSAGPLGPLNQNPASIDQIAAGPKLAGPVAYAHAFAKHGKPIPDAVKAAAAAAVQTGSVQATDLPFDYAYLAPVTVGNTKMLLNFDTGSSDLWVFSKTMPAAQKGKHVIYPDTGRKIASETFGLSYGDGSAVRGIVYADKVTVGGVTATVQAVEAATSVTASFTNGLQDGLLGLAAAYANSCRPRLCNTFMTQVGPSLPIDVFTATLRHNKPGTYDFGFIDKNKYTGTIGYTPISDNQFLGYWEFEGSGWSIGSGPKQGGYIDAIADTGTTLALMEDDIVTAYYSKVAGARLNSTYAAWTFPCTTKLPNFTVFLANGHKAAVPGVYMNHGAFNDGTGSCFGGIQSNRGIGFSILGDTFLRSQFMVFDLSVPRLGFAQQKGIPAL